MATNVSPKIKALLFGLTVLFNPIIPAHAAQAAANWVTPPNRIASVYISEDFLNEQIRQRMKPGQLQELNVVLDPEGNKVFVRGVAQIPTEELRAMNLDAKAGRFRFQMSARLSTRDGNLIIEFPLNETFFYPADSKDGEKEKVIVPVQMLSLALASARGYLAAISGNFASFDRREADLKTQLAALDHSIAREKKPDVLEMLKVQREGLRIQLSAIPVERKQLQLLSKQYVSFLSFAGDKEINLNDEFAARKNTLILKIKLSQLLPYLDGIDLGSVQILKDKKTPNGENYLAINVNSQLDDAIPAPVKITGHDRPMEKSAPSLVVRLNQSLFQSRALVSMAEKKLGNKAEDFKFEFNDDGLHVTGKSHLLLVIPISYDTIVDFNGTGLDEFEVNVREIKVAGLDFDFIARSILDALKNRLNQSLKGIFEFSSLGDQDHSHAMKVTVNPKALIPAFPGLHLVGVDVRPVEFLMEIGKPQT